MKDIKVVSLESTQSMVATLVIIIKFMNLNLCSNKFQISLSHVKI